MVLRKEYDKYLDLTEGYDPDFPNINIGGRKGKKISGKNKIQIEKEYEDSYGSSKEDLGEDTVPYDTEEDRGSEEILNLTK